MKEFVAYTDGSYDMETHYGASGVVVLDKSETQVLYQRAAARRCEPTPEKKQFCQEQELGACIRALRCVPEGSRIIIKTDSQYCCKVLSGEWNAQTNLRLIDLFHEDKRKRHLRVDFVKVKGHSDNKWNELADGLCQNAVNSLRGGGSAILESANLCYQ